MHIVNNKFLLVKGFFIPLSHENVVEVGTFSLLVVGKGRRLLKNALTTLGGMIDLELTNVVVVKGFYVNIISEARLLNAGLWINGFDVTLRFRELINSSIMRILV